MKIFLIIIGCLLAGVAVVGVFLPILPSTPFVLLAAFCFARSSERLNNWLKGTKLFKNNFETFARGKGLTWKAKLRILITVTIVIGIGFFAMKNIPIGRICLFVVWIAHIIAFVFFVKTCPEDTASRKLQDAACESEGTANRELQDPVCEKENHVEKESAGN